eukprot:SAG31_NODE_1274_length_9050_cov_10.910178_8_plen_293_part_00
MSDADGLIHRLESAAELKANGTTALQDGDPEAACAKYMAALEQLDLIPPGCPSESEQFRLLWAECIRQRAMLQLQCHLNAALGWLKLKEWGRAIDAAGAALLLDPQSAKAFFRRGLARKGQRHFEEAQKDLRQAAKLAPKDKAIRGELMIIANELEAASSTSQSEGFTVVKKGELASKLGAVFASGDLYADQPGASDGGMRADRLLEQADDQLDQGRVADALELCKAAMRAVKTMDGEEQARRFRCHAIGGRYESCSLEHSVPAFVRFFTSLFRAIVRWLQVPLAPSGSHYK